MHTETELKMRSLWREVLENETLDFEDNFFEAGGNSLNAMILLDRIQEEFGIEISAVIDNYLKESV